MIFRNPLGTLTGEYFTKNHRFLSFKRIEKHLRLRTTKFKNIQKK